jgi:hypothetical protein
MASRRFAVVGQRPDFLNHPNGHGVPGSAQRTSVFATYVRRRHRPLSAGKAMRCLTVEWLPFGQELPALPAEPQDPQPSDRVGVLLERGVGSQHHVHGFVEPVLRLLPLAKSLARERA